MKSSSIKKLVLNAALCKSRNITPSVGELAIDIANYLVKKKKLGLPQDSAEAFVLLYRAGLISKDLMRRMKGMVGFRNIVVHEYQKLDLGIMEDVIKYHLEEPLQFANSALQIIE